MTSFIPSLFSRMEFIGATKVAVSEQPVNALHLAKKIAEAKSLKVLRKGVAPDRIIHANPCKASALIEYANDNNTFLALCLFCQGVRMMTFDSAEELEKIAKHLANPELVLRIAVSDPTASCPQIGKYGADPAAIAPDLLMQALELGFSVAGVSFHVGSGCKDPSAYRVALKHARNLVDFGRKLGHVMKIVDVGGGFPGGDHHPSFEQMASIIRSVIDEYFPDNDVRFIAEPGRFFVDHPCTLVVNVIARKAVNVKHGETATTHMHYYVNDGVFGCFNCIVYDHVLKCGRPLFSRKTESFTSTIFGPSLDSIDRIEQNKVMRALDVGEWLIYEDMGAYTAAIATTFNGFARPTPVHVVSERIWKILGLAGNNNKN
ncbi:hypothetical protein PRIPAC_81561 [Pristionchus pacificus]|uniref:Uncharacterized protein n=1 Tax=Pristionchus pacificus TaxID=54126 RepID=A0A2A6CPT4_PRIPA|nr:hypothetical protein PRIPAC_81561 [Pristionchus pacificus]|eukprot:PDM80051.1 hypothetical protein PRIPAC_32630 [Pristionchus pacificus]